MHIVPIRAIYIYFVPPEKVQQKETPHTIDLCVTSPIESVGALHARQLKDRRPQKSNLKKPQESFKLHSQCKQQGRSSSPLCITPISVNLSYPCSLVGEHDLVLLEEFLGFSPTPLFPSASLHGHRAHMY